MNTNNSVQIFRIKRLLLKRTMEMKGKYLFKTRDYLSERVELLTILWVLEEYSTSLYDELMYNKIEEDLHNWSTIFPKWNIDKQLWYNKSNVSTMVVPIVNSNSIFKQSSISMDMDNKPPPKPFYLSSTHFYTRQPRFIILNTIEKCLHGKGEDDVLNIPGLEYIYLRSDTSYDGCLKSPDHKFYRNNNNCIFRISLFYDDNDEDVHIVEVNRIHGDHSTFNHVYASLKNTFYKFDAFYNAREPFITMVDGLLQYSVEKQNQIEKYLLNELIVKEVCSFMEPEYNKKIK